MTIAIRPSCRARDSAIQSHILKNRKRNIFAAGPYRTDLIEAAGQFSFSPHALLRCLQPLFVLPAGLTQQERGDLPERSSVAVRAKAIDVAGVTRRPLSVDIDLCSARYPQPANSDVLRVARRFRKMPSAKTVARPRPDLMCSNKQVCQDHKDPCLRDEPTDWPYTHGAEGVGGNVQ